MSSSRELTHPGHFENTLKGTLNPVWFTLRPQIPVCGFPHTFAQEQHLPPANLPDEVMLIVSLFSNLEHVSELRLSENTLTSYIQSIHYILT